jgi:hypothetical protein
MTRSFGHAPGRGRLAEKPHDLGTSDGLVRHSRAHGAAQTLAAVGERGIKPSASRQDVTLVEESDGSQYVRATRDVSKDPRTERQREADEWIQQHGINAPIPRVR